MTSVTVGKVTQNKQVAAKAFASSPQPYKNAPVTVSGPATKQAQLTTGRASSPAQPTSAAPPQTVEITVTQPWDYAPKAGSYTIQDRGRGTPGRLISYTPAKKGEENQITTTTIYQPQGQSVTTNDINNKPLDMSRAGIMSRESGYVARINELGKGFSERSDLYIREINTTIPGGNIIGALGWAGAEFGGGAMAAGRQALGMEPSKTFYSNLILPTEKTVKMTVNPVPQPSEDPMPHYFFANDKTLITTPRMQEEAWINTGKLLGMGAGIAITPTVTSTISKFTRTTQVERIASASTKTGTANWKTEGTTYVSPEGISKLPAMKGTGTVSDFTRTTYMEKQTITGISGSTRLITPVEIGTGGPVKTAGINIKEGLSLSYEEALTKGSTAKSIGVNIGTERTALFTQKGTIGIYKTNIIAAKEGSQVSVLYGKAISTDYPLGITLKDITKFSTKGGAGAAMETGSGTGITQQMTSQMLKQSTSQIPTVTAQATKSVFIPPTPTGLATTKTASLTTLQTSTKTAQLSSSKTTTTTMISLPATTQITRTLQGTGTIQIPTLTTIQSPSTRTIQIQQPTTATTQITRTAQIPTTTTITTTVQMPPNTGITKTITPWTPPTIPWLTPGSLGGGGSPSLKGIGNIFGKQKTKYQSSISAKILNIRSTKQPRIITGVNIRPIIIKRR